MLESSISEFIEALLCALVGGLRRIEAIGAVLTASKTSCEHSNAFAPCGHQSDLLVARGESPSGTHADFVEGKFGSLFTSDSC